MRDSRTWISREEIIEIAKARRNKASHELINKPWHDDVSASRVIMLGEQVRRAESCLRIFTHRVGDRV